MGVVIDADVLISMEKGKKDIFPEILNKSRSENIFISVITVSELLHGVWRARDLNIQTKRHLFVEKIINSIPVVEIDMKVARIHSKLWATLAEKGEMIGIHDSWIAATCISLDFKLFSYNLREFARIDGLKFFEA
jgi:tRNA(fMet)-specific endonuclease VapC